MAFFTVLDTRAKFFQCDDLFSTNNFDEFSVIFIGILKLTTILWLIIVGRKEYFLMYIYKELT